MSRQKTQRYFLNLSSSFFDSFCRGYHSTAHLRIHKEREKETLKQKQTAVLHIEKLSIFKHQSHDSVTVKLLIL
jgi:hypothetical protein